MRRRTQTFSSRQLRLFVPAVPLRWIDIPPETRTRTVVLLARLLRQAPRARRAPAVRDE